MKSLPARIFDAVSRPFVKKQLIESSRTRWREAGPDVGLIWGKTLEGDDFVLNRKFDLFYSSLTLKHFSPHSKRPFVTFPPISSIEAQR